MAERFGHGFGQDDPESRYGATRCLDSTSPCGLDRIQLSGRTLDHAKDSQIVTFYAPAAHERRANQHYPTPPDLAQALPRGLAEAGVLLPRPLYDPCCGHGALLDALGGPSFGSDLYPQAYRRRARWCCRSRSTPRTRTRWPGCWALSRSLVTNPPYGRDAQAIVEAGVELVRARRSRARGFPGPVAVGGGWKPDRPDALDAAPDRAVWRSVWIPGTRGGGQDELRLAGVD